MPQSYLFRRILLEKKAELEINPKDVSGDLTITDAMGLAIPEIARAMPFAGALIGPSLVASTEARKDKRLQAVGSLTAPTAAGYGAAHFAAKGIKKLILKKRGIKDSGAIDAFMNKVHPSELIAKTIVPLVGLKAGKLYAKNKGYLKPTDGDQQQQQLLSHKMDRIISALNIKEPVKPKIKQPAFKPAVQSF
jgi:hypothetical protein